MLQSLEAVDSSSDEGAVQHLNALRNHLLELGKTDGQIQAIRQKGSELPVTKQDVSVFDILQVCTLINKLHSSGQCSLHVKGQQ